jgi:hypothetical protein
VPFSGVFGI